MAVHRRPVSIAKENEGSEAAVRGLLSRVMGESGESIEVGWLNESSEAERFTYEIVAGQPSVRGTNVLAITSGLRELAYDIGCHPTWDSTRWLDLPADLEDQPLKTRTSNMRDRYYLNFVTFAYSTAFWNWERWEREIDWMALHGVTMPLMLIGQEAILYETYRELGLSDERIAEWIGGAAYFPWTWMGGTNEWGGPLPKSWIRRHLDLALMVLAREKDFGMTPVLPGFMGHVPPELAPPGTRTISWQGWATPVLSPRSPEFRKTAEVYYRHQRRLLGPCHHFAVDPFIESVPPVSQPRDLAGISKGIYDAMQAVDPEAVWVLQGWPFHYHADFWTDERVRAFLDSVPNKNLLVLDLWAEYAPIWRRTDALWGRRWLWCAVHNFGSRPALFGDLSGLLKDITEVKTATSRGQLGGVGITTEAIENNSVFYELFADAVWDPAPELESWLDRYARSRYNTGSLEARQAWKILARTLYGPGKKRSVPSPVIARPWSESVPFASQRLAGESIESQIEERPSANVDAETDPSVLGNLAAVADVVELLGVVAKEPHVDHETVEHDLVELASYIIAQHSRLAIRGLSKSYLNRDLHGLEQYKTELESSLFELDSLLGTRAEMRVAHWIESARDWGDTGEEADIMERDARRLVSVWGRQTSGLQDYSGRHWQGMVSDLYLPRWMAWADWLSQSVLGSKPARLASLQSRIVAIEEAWVKGGNSYTTEPRGNPVEFALAAVRERREQLEALRAEHGEATGRHDQA